VLVVGAGPVGMCLALDLAWRGVDVTVIDQRADGQPPSVKCNHVAARTMEAFRRLGFVDKVRDAGLPADHPHDVAFRTTVTGIEFGRIPIPCRRDRYTTEVGPDANWPTPEPPHRINQIYLEPVLAARMRSEPRINVLYGTRCVEISQDNDRAVATVEDLGNGETSRMSAPYLVGCDGGSSLARRSMGASLHGDDDILRTQSTYIRAPGLRARMSASPAWGTFSMNRRRAGVAYAIDGRERWIVHNYLRDEESGFDMVDRDGSVRAILGVDGNFRIDVIGQEDWIGRRLVVDRIRDRRVFLCGDAAHLWVPYAGYGMNAGIADALNLSWMLAAVIEGWGGPALLGAYEAERLPITEQVSHYAMKHALAVARQRREVPAEIEDETEAGEAARVALGERAYALNVAQYACAGLNFGYFYEDSPVIVRDAEAPPSYSMQDYTPSTVPGCRAPHLRLADGRSLYDALGPGLTLLCPANADPGASDHARRALAGGAAARAIPLASVHVDGPDAAELYEDRLVLVRPDQHIAWRGRALPPDHGELLDRVTGQVSGPRTLSDQGAR